MSEPNRPIKRRGTPNPTPARAAGAAPSETAKSVLLIGGAGYIGPVIAEHLLGAGYKVRVLDCFVYRQNLSILHLLPRPGFEFVNGDFCDESVLDAALEGAGHAVILGGLVGDPITKTYPELSAAINGQGIERCIDRLTRSSVDRVIFVSTCSNYGLMTGGRIANENSELNPLSLYAKAKVAAEQHLLAQKGRTRCAPTILRFATAFGLAPRMRFDLSVNEFVRELALGRELVVYDADTWRPYCHVGDFARLIKLVLEADADAVGFEVFNAGGDVNNATKRQLVERIGRYLPAGRVKYQEHGSDPRNYRVDFAKVRDVLGFEPQYDLDFGIREIIGAIRQGIFDHVEAARTYFGNYEVFYRGKD